MFQTSKYQVNDSDFDKKYDVLHNKPRTIDPVELEHQENKALILYNFFHINFSINSLPI
jgi:hypothetical protein